MTVTDREQLVRENIGWMLALAQRLMGERALAEDAVQDAYMDAFRGLDKFAGQSSIKTWLRRITINSCLMKLRRMKRLAETPIDEFMPEFDAFNCLVEPRWNHLASVEDVMQNADLRNTVQQGIARLPDAYRIVLELRDIEGFDTAEVSEMLDLTESNVKVRLHRARAALKKILEPLMRGEVEEP